MTKLAKRKEITTYDVGVWLNTEFFAQALEQLFEIAWNNFKPVK